MHVSVGWYGRKAECATCLAEGRSQAWALAYSHQPVTKPDDVDPTDDECLRTMRRLAEAHALVVTARGRCPYENEVIQKGRCILCMATRDFSTDLDPLWPTNWYGRARDVIVLEMRRRLRGQSLW